MGLKMALCILTRGSWAMANGGRAGSKTHNNSHSEPRIVSFTMQGQRNRTGNIDSTHRPICLDSYSPLINGVWARHDSTILPLSHSHRGFSPGNTLQYRMLYTTDSSLVPAFNNGDSIYFVAARFNQLYTASLNQHRRIPFRYFNACFSQPRGLFFTVLSPTQPTLALLFPPFSTTIFPTPSPLLPTNFQLPPRTHLCLQHIPKLLIYRPFIQ